jgi:site-specific DNA recombinase
VATPATRRFIVEGQAATLFNAVQARLNEQLNSHKVSRRKSGALLVGRIFDDRGNRMTPSHARKNGTKYRYYISSVLVQGKDEQAGTVNRIPAADVEARIIKAVRSHTCEDNDLDDRKLINERLIRIEVQAHKLVVELAKARAAGSRQRA